MIGNRSSLLAVAGIGPTFGEKYANPSTLPAGNGTKAVFTPDENALIVTHTSSPYISAYQWSSNGFGTKYANPGQLPPFITNGVEISQSGSHIFTTSGSLLLAYSWTYASGFGARQSTDLSALIGNSPRPVAMHPSGSYICVAGNGIAIVPWTGSAFGTPYLGASGATLSTDVRELAFSPDGNYLAVSGVDMGIAVYRFESGTLGTRYSASTGDVYTVSFNPTGDFIACSGQNGRALEIFNWSPSGFGSSVAVPSPNSWGTPPLALSFSPQNNMLALGSSSSSSPIRCFRWMTTYLGSIFADPPVMPTGAAFVGNKVVSFSPSGNSLAIAHNNSPAVTVYKIITQS